MTDLPRLPTDTLPPPLAPATQPPDDAPAGAGVVERLHAFLNSLVPAHAARLNGEGQQLEALRAQLDARGLTEAATEVEARGTLCAVLASLAAGRAGP